MFWVSNKWGYSFRAYLSQALAHATQGHSKIKTLFSKGTLKNGPKGWGCIPMGILVLCRRWPSANPLRMPNQ